MTNRTAEAVRTSLGAPDFTSVSVWQIPTAQASSNPKVASETARAAGLAGTWGAGYGKQVTSVGPAVANALIAAGARQIDTPSHWPAPGLG